MKYYHIFMISSIFILFLLYFITKKITKMKKFFIFLVLFINLIYIGIRFSSIPIFCGIPSLVLGTLLFMAEFLGLFSFCVYTFIFTGKRKQPIKRLDDLNGNIPTVDILICTYNEDLELLSKTIIAAQKLDYPKDKFKVYVLDDGHRNNLKEMCSKYNVNYITRPNNTYAKAGNINNALKFINGDLFVVLDADMICKKNFLQKTVGYFSDNNLAFVQTPQTYYNPDIYQYNISKKFNNEQDFFMRYIEEARNTKDAVLHVGTNAVFRRTFVDEVGGYPTSSITEDMALGLLLQAKGYNSMFINEALVCGLSASTYPELVKQRDRWCRGNLQVLKNFKKVIFKKLKLKQKIIYLDGVLYWFTGIIKLIYILTPAIYLLTGTVIVNLPPAYLLPLFLLAFIGQILLSKIILPKEISKNYFSFFMKGEFYNTIMAPHLAFSVLKHYFFSDTKFSVTEKNSSTQKGHYYLKLALPHFVLLFISILSLIFGTINLGKKIYPQAYYINLFWILYNIPCILLAIKIAYQPPRQLKNEGIPISISSKAIIDLGSEKVYGFVTEVSETFVKINIKQFKNILKINQEVNTIIDEIPITCIVKEMKNNELKLQYKNPSYKQLFNIMDILLNNLKPYKKNLKI